MTLQTFSTQELQALKAKLECLLQVTEQADCRPVYIAALHGLRAELEARQVEAEEICAAPGMNGSGP